MILSGRWAPAAARPRRRTASPIAACTARSLRRWAREATGKPAASPASRLATTQRRPSRWTPAASTADRAGGSSLVLVRHGGGQELQRRGGEGPHIGGAVRLAGFQC